MSFKYYIGVTLIVSIVGIGISYVITTISAKNDTIKRLQSELIISQAEMLIVNKKLQEQAEQFSSFNQKQEAYKTSLIQKYASFNPTNQECDNSVLNAMIRKSLE